MKTFIAPSEGVAEGHLDLTRGGRHVAIRSGDMDDLVRAEFEGVVPAVRAGNGRVAIEYPRFSIMELLRNPGHRASIELTGSVPWSLAFGGGLGDSQLDLRDVQLQGLEIAGGASGVSIRLPAPRGRVGIRVHGGASKVQIVRPEGVAVALVVGGGASKLTLDDERYGAIGGTTRLETPNATREDDRFEIEISGGVSELTVARDR